uniref:Uncharacterized protein n=1 Tax=Phenylobacterium glaciei TaxID=2803784 RepID=A0A974P1F3_9CAUL|nr:hypothetical protein JKL49_13995 [Phenylobacterium glaciei]
MGPDPGHTGRLLRQPAVRRLRAGDRAGAPRAGVDIWTPPGIDLKKDLDDLAALTCALDLTVGFANATSNIGAACGAPCWLISTPGAWPRVGTDHYPWYPQMRVFLPPGFQQWDAVMVEVAEALTQFAGS